MGLSLAQSLDIGASQQPGGGEPPPQLPAGVFARWDGGEGVADTDGAVDTWADQSGNGYTLTGITGKKPTTNVSTLNGRNVLDFTADGLVASDAADWGFLHATASTIYIVVRPGATANPDTIYRILGNSTGGAIPGYLLSYDDRSSVSRHDRLLTGIYNGSASVAAIVSGDDALPANDWTIVSVLTDPANETPALRSIANTGGADVANNTQANAAGGTNSVPLCVGCVDANANNVPLTGSIAEVVIYDTLHDPDDVTAARAALAAKWGL